MTEQEIKIQEGIIREQIREVYIYRKELVRLDTTVKGSREFWEEENAHLLIEQKMCKEAVEMSESKLKETSIALFKETSNKAPGPGVEIKMFQVLNYEPLEAFNWARDTGLALQLDKKIFEKIAKADPPDFVTITEEPKVTIATDLGKVLGEKGEK